MYLIAGLGNPDKKYDLTRHNVGFDMLDVFASGENIKLNKTKFKSVYGEGTVSDNFVRIRIGVGAKPSPDYDLAAHVLGRFSKEDIAILDKAAQNVSGAIKLIVSDGNCDKAMNRYNGK